ncbi:MAG: 1,4-alpha-glucan branching enzyme, partial [Traorella sp.]
SEYPFDGSWGYQSTGYFSVTSRYGTLNGLKELINKLHLNHIGVIMDFVPVHFVKDNHSLNYYDGTPLYEYDKESDANSEWGTSNFNLWREEVRSFLMSAANFWLDIFHVDGLRMDAISNLIFWQGNKSRGVNEGALHFVKRMNNNLHRIHPTAFLIAEDSSDYPKVTAPSWADGLEFDYKWDLGWMNDTLKYLQMDPIYRQYHHDKITFSMFYTFNERFILPLSHDEVVHGKLTIVDKMWGTYEEKFPQARTLYMYMMTHPGKKLNFMGNEFAQIREFDENKENDWFMLKYPLHDSFQKYIAELNRLTCENEAFYQVDNSWDGFKWIDADNNKDNMFIYQRMCPSQKYIVVLNFSKNHYKNFRMGVEKYCYVKEVLNTDADIYSGHNIRNLKALRARKLPHNGLNYSVEFEIAPFSGIIFEVKEMKKCK